jgi:hypothetical protein
MLGRRIMRNKVMNKKREISEGALQSLDASDSNQPQDFILVDGKRYIRDKPVDGEVIKLQVGEFIQGVLLDKFPSVKFKGKKIYKIKQKDDPIVKILVGTTMLDKVLSPYEVNDLVLVKRLEDIHSDNPNDMQQYVTYHPEE